MLMEQNKGKGNFFCFSSAKGEDMISKLADSLISQILMYLPTKEAVGTSVLSSRWKSLWLLIPWLDLNSNEFPDYKAFARFVDKCLDFFREEKACLHKLKLSIHKGENDNDQFCVTRWIDFVATHKIKHLDVECFVKRNCLEVIPISLFICETLLSLSLRRVSFGSFEESFVSLPRLKTMRLELNVYANEKSLESLIASCPVLENLSFVRREDDNVKVLRVRSQTLISLSIKYSKGISYDDFCPADDFDYGQLGVSIDAPRLEYLNLEDEISESKTITNSGSLTKVDILGRFYLKNNDDQVHKFFANFSSVRDLKISYNSFKYNIDMVPLPLFGYLDTLPMLLGSCPNLKSLILDLEIIDAYVVELMRLSPEPPMCLLSSLEFIEITRKSRKYPILGLASYFAENSVILKKLVLCLGEEEDLVVVKNLLALPRLSRTCQIIVC